MKKTIGAKGFTLVELLVVIAIIGMLVGLLLPAVQQAREAARTMQCSNKLKQMGLAALNHESTNKAFPSCGWSCDWEGDPDFGFGPNQPGSWCYSLLPFLEQNALWQLGSDGDKSTGGEIKNANTTRLKTPISIFYCPSRRPPNLMNGHTAARNNNAFTGGVAKSDYAANGGDGWSWTNYGSVDEGLKANYTGGKTGMFYPKTAITMGEIRDGTTNTYLYGEKYMDPQYYDAAVKCAQGDDWNCWMGPESNDLSRYTQYRDDQTNQPLQDRVGYDHGNPFGSAHAGSFGMVMCDGSSQRISYSIDKELHSYLGKKADGEAAQIPN